MVDFSQMGGVATVRAGGDPNDPQDVIWNFGISGRPGREGDDIEVPERAFATVAPHLQGRWDGKATICHPELHRKVNGHPQSVQYQVRGTCGGRAGRNLLGNIQVVMMSAGRRATFRQASHAWIYYLARKKYNMLKSGGPQVDGVASGSVPIVLAESGVLSIDEANDTNASGPGSDDLAVRWGGNISPPSRELAALALDNLIMDWAQLQSAQDIADALASGGAVISSDESGFTNERDSDGFCRRSGTWYHYHAINGVAVTPSGRKGFSYEQTWDGVSPVGSNLLMNGAFPSNCFGVDWDAADEMCRVGRVHAVFGFALWDEKSVVEIDWRKIF